MINKITIILITSLTLALWCAKQDISLEIALEAKKEMIAYFKESPPLDFCSENSMNHNNYATIISMFIIDIMVA